MKQYIISLFLVFSTFICADGLQSKDERIDAIDKQIESLMLKQRNLELLKEQIIQSTADNVFKGDHKEKRPTIALVLSGGGAKGAAHIGVLKVLEKYNVPIDIVIGTSIGSIIGGMYSIGYTPDEIEKTVLNLDFFSLFNNSKDRKFKNIEEKTMNELYPFTVTIDKNMNLSLPMGFTNGEKVYLQLKDIFAPAETIHDFDKFPIRYRAITTNLNTGQEVVLSSGDLALSAFKSMAIPSFVEPIQDNGSYYVDGGVVNNFPIEEAIKMGADIIIAVDISADDTKINQNSSVISILDKISTYNGNRNTKFQKQLANILIVPDVKNRNTLDFENLQEMIDEGEKAANKYGYLFENIKYPTDYAKIHDQKLKDLPITITNIKLTGNSVLTLSKVKRLTPNVKNHKFTTEDLYLWSKKIYSIPYIEKVIYDVNGDTITFSVVEKPGINIKAALNYTSQYGESINVAATVPNFGKWTRNYTLMAEISQYPKIGLNNLSFYEFNKLKLLGSFNIGFESDPLFVYKNKDNITTFINDTFKANIGLATSFSNSLVVGLNGGYENTNSKYQRGDKSITEFKDKYQLTLLNAFFFLDTLDHPYFPSKGVSMLIEQINGKRIDEGYFNGFKGHFNMYYPLNKDFSLSLGTSFGKLTGKNIPGAKLFKIGGLRSTNKYIGFVGLPLMGEYAKEFYIGYAGFQYNLASSLYLIGKYNAMTFASDEMQFQSKKKINDTIEHGYGVGIGWDTFLGPISVMVSNNIHSSAPLIEVYLGYIF